MDSALASRHPMRRAVTTQPDFYTVFGSGVTIGTPRYGVAKHINITITGTDAVTGYSDTALDTIYGTGTQYEFWGIGDMESALSMDGDLTTPGDGLAPNEYLTYFENTITTPTNPLIKGGRQLTNSCLVRETGSPNPQTHLYVGIQSAAALANPVEAQYFEFDFILPSGLDLQAGDTGTGKFWVTPLEIKTGAWYDTGATAYKQAVGDFRIKVGCTGTDTGGVNRWQVIADNEANGRSVIPELSVTPYDDVYKYVDITNTDEPVLLGVRTNAKIYYKRPEGGVSDTTTGRLKVVIKPEGYEAFTICNIGEGYQLTGQLHLPITRIFWGTNYTSADLPNATILESVAVYNNPTASLMESLFR